MARQKDLMNAWSSGQVDTVVELTKLVHDGATQMKELVTPVSSFCGCEHGSMSAVRWCRAVNALYGYRGVRVGEVCHPGTKHKRRRRVAESSEDSGSGLLPTLLDDVEQDLAVPGTEIDMSVRDSLQGVSVPQDVILALEHDLCGHHCGRRSPLVTPNVRARVLGVAEVDQFKLFRHCASEFRRSQGGTGIPASGIGARCTV